ncbi:ABC transporter substrate-binding protein [Chlamydiifrater volucris]|uniref:ABC transporter substrate-binding protein n=1 Tax=Chlamydiifrater volucris TaxID=2681470 RepID=UPI001BCD2807|nr:ABC transporter substrate-binding protein [Chlamydiifrater volucris]
MSKRSPSFLSLWGLFFFAGLVAVIYIFDVSLPWQEKESFQAAINAKPTSSTLVIALSDTPTTMHPHDARRALDLSLIRQLFEGLVRENSQNPEGIELAAAQNVYLSEDGKCYTFKLKKTFWSNGEPVTSCDFLRSWQRAAKLSIFSSLFEDIETTYSELDTTSNSSLRLYAPDPETFIVYLKHPQVDFLKKVSCPTFFPIYRLRTKQLVSNGAYRLHTQSSNHSILLEKNPFYHDIQANTVPYINLSVVFNIQTASRLLEKQGIHWLGQPWNQSLPNEIKKRLKQKKIQQVSHPIKGSFWLTINPEREYLKDPSLRRALSENINKAHLVDYILQGNQAIATTLTPTTFSPSSKPITFSSNDITSSGGKLSLSYPSDILQCVRIAEFLQQEWKTRLGLHVCLKGVEYRRLIEERSKKCYDIVTQTGTALYPGKEGFYPIILKQFSDIYSETNADLLKTTPVQRQEDFLLENHIVIPLYHLSQEFFLSIPIKNIIFCSDGSVDLKYVELCSKR